MTSRGKYRKYISALDRLLIASAQHGRCAYCSDNLRGPWFEIDHIWRIKRDSRACQLFACCGTCHNRKTYLENGGRSDADELRKMIALARQSCVTFGKTLYVPEWLEDLLSEHRWRKHRTK